MSSVLLCNFLAILVRNLVGRTKEDLFAFPLPHVSYVKIDNV